MRSITPCSRNATHRLGTRVLQAPCVAQLSGVVGCASTHHREGSGEYFDGSGITGKVKAAVLNEPGLKSSEINVETFKGAVQMCGFVESQQNIDRAVALARGIPGVTAFNNAMLVDGRR